MSIKQWNAGIIRPVPVAPAGPYQNGAAPGVWTLDQAAYWQKQGLWPVAGNLPPKGLFIGGYRSVANNTIDYVNILTTGNAVDFGDMLTAGNGGTACSSSTVGVFTIQGSQTAWQITFATAGNATSFSTLGLPAGAQGNTAACSNSTRGLIAGAYASSPWASNMYYLTFASAGAGVYFGDLSQQRGYSTGVASTTRGVFAGGQCTLPSYSAYNTIDYVTIATTGNATDFGDLLFLVSSPAGCSNSTRGIVAGGYNRTSSAYTNVIQYMTIATTGNSTDFGDLIFARDTLAACSSTTRGVFSGGYNGSNSNVIEYVSIDTTGNSTDFGDLTQTSSSLMSCSNAHGGLA